MKRPSSERPIESADESRNNLKMFTTMNNPSSEINMDSVSGEVSRKGIGSTPHQTNNFTHEAMLLSMYGKTSRDNVPGGTFFPKQRANSHFR